MTIHELIEQISSLEKTYGGDTEVGVFKYGDLACLSHASTMKVLDEDGKPVVAIALFQEDEEEEE